MEMSQLLTTAFSARINKLGTALAVGALAMGLLLGASAAQAEPPVADAGGPYNNIVAGTPFTFDGSGSYDPDPDGEIVSYDWDFGDGSPHGTGVSPTHTYSQGGNYQLTLEVMDNDDELDIDTFQIQVQDAVNKPPVPDAGGTYTGVVGSPVAFNGSGSFDPDGTIEQYVWDFGDNTFPSYRFEENPSHTYATAGDYQVILSVTDDDGATEPDFTEAVITEAQPTTAGSLFKKVSCPAQDVIILPPGERTEIDDIIVSANQDQIFKLKLSPLDFIITQLSMKAQEPVVINFSGIVESLEEGSLEEQSIQLDCSGNGNLFITLVGSKTGM